VECADVKKAVARIVIPNGVQGTVIFEEVDDGVHVTASIEGLSVGPHGFHVHQYGDIRQLSLATLGYHFIYSCELDVNNSCANDQQHGFPPSEVRHPGDMGNIQVIDSDYPAIYDEILGQQKMSLSSSLKSIVGRAVLVHLGNDTGVQPYGNASGPAAAGVIGLMNTELDDDNNEAMGPDAPPADKLVCVFAGDDDISGTLLVTNAFSSPDFRVQFNISGLSEGEYSLTINTYGDLTEADGDRIGPLWSWSSSDVPSNFDFKVGKDQEQSGSVAYDVTWDRVDSLRDAIGRACALRMGDEEGEIMAVGVVGLAHIDAEIFTNVEKENAGSALSPLSLVTPLLILLSLSRLF
jgi:Cu-Zn family superoxide dismutase